MNNTVALNIIKYFNYKDNNLCLLVDEAYTEIAQSIMQHHEKTEIIILQSNEPKDVRKVFDSLPSVEVLLLAEPTSYIKYRLFEYLDFSNGEPEIQNTTSKVLIYPKESLCRIFSESAANIAIGQEKAIMHMQDNKK